MKIAARWLPRRSRRPAAASSVSGAAIASGADACAQAAAPARSTGATAPPPIAARREAIVGMIILSRCRRACARVRQYTRNAAHVIERTKDVTGTGPKRGSRRGSAAGVAAQASRSDSINAAICPGSRARSASPATFPASSQRRTSTASRWKRSFSKRAASSQRHRPALQLQGHERGRAQLRQVIRVRREQIALRGDVQTDGLGDLGRESLGEPAAADALMARIGGPFAEVVWRVRDQMADVVQQRGHDERRRRAGRAREVSRLQPVLHDGNALAEVGIVAPVRIERKDLVHDAHRVPPSASSRRRSAALL